MSTVIRSVNWRAVSLPAEEGPVLAAGEGSVLSAIKQTDVIYLDDHATTRLDPRALEAMMPYLTENFANPNSRHQPGDLAEKAVTLSRTEVAELIGGDRSEIIFTSGATEANYAALLGAGRARRGHIISSTIEHKSVLAALEVLEKDGHAVTLLAPNADGRIEPEAVAAALRDDTILVTLMLANNEIGSLNPIAEIAALLRGRPADRYVLLHTDAAQAVGRIEINVDALDVDLLSLSGHKLYGPKGVGALYVRARTGAKLAPLIRGGGQESGRRGGTLNVPGIVGLGRASELARAELHSEPKRVGALRDRLQRTLRESIPGLVINGAEAHRLPGNLSVSLPGVSGDTLMKRLVERLAVSSGSACAAGSDDVSHVLRGIGLDQALARATVRFGLGRFTKNEDIDEAARILVSAFQELRSAARDMPVALPVKRSASDPDLTMQSIGHVSNDVAEPQYIEWGGVRSRIVIDERFRAALRGLGGYSHVNIVSWLHLASSPKNEHVPQGRIADVPEVGMFACRCPYRPNPIAVSTVRLIAVEADAIVVEGLDAVNGTPVLDVKPYTPQVDLPKGEVRVPEWVDRLTY